MSDIEKIYTLIGDEVDVALHELRGKYGSDSPHVTFANACELVKIREQRELAVEIYNLHMALKP